MRSRFPLLLVLAQSACFTAEPEFPLTEDSKLQPSVPKGTLLKENYAAKEGSVFPGTQREYQIYLPAGHDKTKPAAFMVFQDGVIYQAPVVFDNLIAKKDIPPLVGIFIKPGVVPAANDNALPRFNRSYEYDSITPTYSQFLIDEFLPAIEAKHGLKLSTDPNHAAISGNSSGGICAFMTAWHRPDRFRRVFTGVGTYVGIHGADQLPVLVRKFEPKPLRVFLQSGTGDNNLYCGDWWMANQMMERSLTWAGYDVNHTWGEGGHNQKHASQIFPDVLRWLWRDWQTNIEVKANPKDESKWRGYEVVGDGEWKTCWSASRWTNDEEFVDFAPNLSGDLAISIGDSNGPKVKILDVRGELRTLATLGDLGLMWSIMFQSNGQMIGANTSRTLKHTPSIITISPEGKILTRKVMRDADQFHPVASFHDGRLLASEQRNEMLGFISPDQFELQMVKVSGNLMSNAWGFELSPDQTQLYVANRNERYVNCYSVSGLTISNAQPFGELENSYAEGDLIVSDMCVDANGWLYVATSIGIQVLDQAGRVNFIITVPTEPSKICFAGNDLSELFIACADNKIYKRPTKAKGVVSGQQAPIKPPPPKL